MLRTFLSNYSEKPERTSVCKVLSAILLSSAFAASPVWAQLTEEFDSVGVTMDCTAVTATLNFGTVVAANTPYKVSYYFNVVSDDELTIINHTGELASPATHAQNSTLSLLVPAHSIAGEFYLEGSATLKVETTTPGQFETKDQEEFEIDLLSLNPCVEPQV